MFKTPPLLILLLPLINVFGGETYKNKTSIGIDFSPNYGYRHLSTKNDLLSNEILNEHTFALPGFTSGINLGFESKGSFAFEFGFEWINAGYKSKFEFEFESQESDTYIPFETIYIDRFYYLSIPMKGKYHIINKKIDLFFTLGTAPGILICQQSKKTNIYDNKKDIDFISEISNLNPFKLEIIAGIQLKHPLSKKLTLKIEPTYRQSLTSLFNEQSIHLLYSAGINVGIDFYL
jgi:hypothetical protein